MLTAAEAKSLSGIARQIRGLLAGIDQLPEAFDLVEGVEVQLASAKKELARVGADVAATRATFAQVDSDLRALHTQYAQLDQQYRTKKEMLEDSLVTVRTELAEAQQLKQETEHQLAAITAKLTA